jgi:fumarate reductase flavoprotein subunit
MKWLIAEKRMSKKPIRAGRAAVCLFLAAILGMAACSSQNVRQDKVYTADVAVIGSGVSGLAAAIEAADNGAKVILLEKRDIPGGASALSGGELIAAGTDMQKAEGINDRWEDLADFWIKIGEGHVNEGMLRRIAENAPNTVTWMQANGVEFMEHLQTPTSEPWANPKRTHKTANGAGTGFTGPLAASAERKGVRILLGTPATGLITENGAVTGVYGQNAEGTAVTVKAKKVILATGGFENNPELLAQYSPLITIGSAVGAAHNGDGLMWARQLGSPIVAGGGGIILAINFHLIGASGDLDPYGAYLYVDTRGRRFMDEGEYWFRRSRRVLDLPDQKYYAIFDSKAPAEKGIDPDAGLETKMVFKADSLIDLAGQIGIDPAALESAVERYNAAAAKGVDEDFGKDPAKLSPIDQAPYYAALGIFTANTGSFGGPKINDNCQVLDAAGQPIPGLYAAGEAANGEIFYKAYPISGSAIQCYTSMGRIAGAHAANN